MLGAHTSKESFPLQRFSSLHVEGTETTAKRVVFPSLCEVEYLKREVIPCRCFEGGHPSKRAWKELFKEQGRSGAFGQLKAMVGCVSSMSVDRKSQTLVHSSLVCIGVNSFVKCLH